MLGKRQGTGELEDDEDAESNARRTSPRGADGVWTGSTALGMVYSPWDGLASGPSLQARRPGRSCDPGASHQMAKSPTAKSPTLKSPTCCWTSQNLRSTRSTWRLSGLGPTSRSWQSLLIS